MGGAIPDFEVFLPFLSIPKVPQIGQIPTILKDFCFKYQLSLSVFERLNREFHPISGTVLLIINSLYSNVSNTLSKSGVTYYFYALLTFE